MAVQKALILKDGKIQQLNSAVDSIEGASDFLSGTDLIPTGETLVIPLNRQSINFTHLTIDGTLTLDGNLWLA